MKKHNLKRRIIIKSLISFVLLFSLASCTQLLELSRMQQCNFKFKDVSNIRLSNINIQNINSFSSLRFADAAKLLAAYSSGNLPLTFTLNLEAKNPNSMKASMNGLEWIAIIDDIEVAKGNVSQSIVIPPNNVSTEIPISVSVNLLEVLSGKSKTTILDFGMNLAGVGNNKSRVKIKIKPNIKVGNAYLPMPGYITLSPEI